MNTDTERVAKLKSLVGNVLEIGSYRFFFHPDTKIDSHL